MYRSALRLEKSKLQSELSQWSAKLMFDISKAHVTLINSVINDIKDEITDVCERISNYE